MQSNQAFKTQTPDPQTRNPDSQNARVHGLTATNPAVTRSEKIRFNRFRKTLLAELDPRSVTELLVAEQIVLHRWFLAQCDAAEAACMRAAVHDFHHPRFTVTDALNPTAGQLKYKLAQVNTPRSRADRNDHDLRLAYNAPDLDKIHRYRKEHQRTLDRALTEWHKLIQPRPAPTEPEPDKDFTKRNPEKHAPTSSRKNTYDRPNRPPSPAQSPELNPEPAPKPSKAHKTPSAGLHQPVSFSRRSTSMYRIRLTPRRAGSSSRPAPRRRRSRRFNCTIAQGIMSGRITSRNGFRWRSQ